MKTAFIAIGASGLLAVAAHAGPADDGKVKGGDKKIASSVVQAKDSAKDPDDGVWRAPVNGGLKKASPALRASTKAVQASTRRLASGDDKGEDKGGDKDKGGGKKSPAASTVRDAVKSQATQQQATTPQ